jgi:hypothetical protein
VVDAYERNTEQRRDYRNDYYERDLVTVLGTLRLRIARNQTELSAGWSGRVSKARGGGINAHSQSIFARYSVSRRAVLSSHDTGSQGN